MSQSCKDCASCMLAANIAVEAPKAGKNFGADVCSTFGKVLSLPTFSDADNDAVKMRTGESCPKFTTDKIKSAADADLNENFPVVTGDPMAIMKVTDLQRTGTRSVPASCNACEFFVPGDVVRGKYGWTAGLCAVKGHLIDTTRTVTEARACNDGNAGTPRDNADGMLLFPTYSGFSPVATSASSGGRIDGGTYSKHNKTHPRLWETERPVTAEDAENGIRAWRAIDDPDQKRPPLYMPIYDEKILFGDWDPASTYGAMFPDLYVDHQFLLYDFAFLYGAGVSHEEDPCLDEVMALIGEAGTGKTEFACYVAWLMNLPFIRIVVTPATEVSDFYGETGLVIDEKSGQQVTEFKKGRFSTWLGKPCVLLIDEPNMGREEVWAPMRSAWDGAKEIIIDSAQGVSVRKDRRCYPIMAMNPSWDPLYVGTNPINMADLRRTSPITIVLPPDHVERAIVRSHCQEIGYDITDATLDTLAAIAADLRALRDTGELAVPWGVGLQVKAAKMTWRLSLPRAFQRAAADGFEPAIFDQIMAVVAAHDAS